MNELWWTNRSSRSVSTGEVIRSKPRIRNVDKEINRIATYDSDDRFGALGTENLIAPVIDVETSRKLNLCELSIVNTQKYNSQQIALQAIVKWLSASLSPMNGGSHLVCKEYEDACNFVFECVKDMNLPESGIEEKETITVTLKKFGETPDEEFLADLGKKLRIKGQSELIVCDECHYVTSRHFKVINSNKRLCKKCYMNRKATS